MKNLTFSVRWDDIVLPLLALVMLASQARALGTLAGTAITTQATLAYVDGTAQLLTSAPVTVTVAKSPSVKVTLGKLSDTVSGPKSVPCIVTNTGNYDNTVAITVSCTGGVTATVVQDVNANGLVEVGDSQPSASGVVIPAGKGVALLLVMQPTASAKAGDKGIATVSAACVDAPAASSSASFTATLVKGLVPRFTFNAGDSMKSSPIVVNGVAIAGSESGVVYATKIGGPSAGCLAWRFPAEGNLGAPIRGRVATDGTNYFFTANNGCAYRLARDGSLVWQKQVVPSFTTLEAMPVVVGDTVKLACGDGRVRTLDKATGTVLATSASVGGGSLSTPSIPQQGGLWVGGADGTLYNMDDLNNDTVVTAVTVSARPVSATPFVDAYSGLVLTCSQEGNAYAFLARSNSVVWGPVALGSPIMGSPWVDARASIVYFAGADARLHARRLADGCGVTGYPVKVVDNGGFTNTPVVAPLLDGRSVLFAASTSGRLYGFDAQSPNAFAQFDANDPAASFVGAPALSGRGSDDVIVAAATNGKLYGFRIGDVLD